MLIFEWIVGVSFGAVALTALARRLGIPYPAFLALGGVALSFVPAVPNLRLDPELALALFVAPILLDAGFDTSLRDLKANWRPILGLAVGAVIATTFAVAAVARYLVPDLPWSACIVLGAIVAPPDSVAALSVLRQVSLPHRLATILRGESLLNDAGSLMIYRIGVATAMAGGGAEPPGYGPTFLIGIVASLVAGPVLARIAIVVQRPIKDAPSAIVLQFATGFALWIAAERLGMSAVLTVVTYALTIARFVPEIVAPRSRVIAYAVWDTAVFVLNVLAFVLIGIQIEPIFGELGGAERTRALVVAAAVFVTVVAVRLAWALVVSGIRDLLARPGQPADSSGVWPRPALAVGWAGMRGVVTIATALALPEEFPQRDLVVTAAFGVVIGTLVLQGLTLRPVFMLLRLEDDDPVGRETGWARARAYEAAIGSLQACEADEAVAALRAEFEAALKEAEQEREGLASETLPADAARRQAIAAARDAVLRLRREGRIGDDAFFRLEEEFDWAELSATPATEAET